METKSNIQPKRFEAVTTTNLANAYDSHSDAFDAVILYSTQYGLLLKKYLIFAPLVRRTKYE